MLGEFSGDVNSVGIVGISSDAIVSACSHSIGSAAAINQAASRLRAGDIILLEMHRPGPRFNFASRADQRGYIAVEWWPDDFAAILNANHRAHGAVHAARFRDSVGLGRKRAIQILEFFDRVGFTRRTRDDHRIRGDNLLKLST